MSHSLTSSWVLISSRSFFYLSHSTSPKMLLSLITSALFLVSSLGVTASPVPVFAPNATALAVRDIRLGECEISSMLRPEFQ
jgi:hypothetical protein